MITIKRVYEPADKRDGVRFLVDRLWPRGLSKDKARLGGWMKEVAPSDRLRKWFGHEPAKWAEFQRRYFAELDENPELWAPVLRVAQKGRVTLLFSAHDVEHNNAVVLKTYLTRKMRRTSTRTAKARVAA